MEITKREIIMSISIIAFMLIIGIMISGKISDNIVDRNEKYNKALKIESQEIFEYGMRTNIGNAFVYGTIKAIDTVSYPEISGEYSYILKVKERYTMHTRTVTVRTGKTTSTRVETYWTWDTVKKEDKISKKVTFLNNEFNYSQFNMPHHSYIKTIRESSHVRYKYYSVPAKITGTIFANLKDNDIGKDVDIYINMKTVEAYENSLKDFSTPLFWIIWIVFIVGVVFGFYYLDNKWLD